MDREDQGASGHDSDGDWAGDPEGDGLRGWISPDDRLWRHPSESSETATGSATVPAGGMAQRGRKGIWFIGGTACLVLALVATGLLVATTGGGDEDSLGSGRGPSGMTGTPATEPGTPPLGTLPTMKVLAASTVALRITGPGGTTDSTGLVAESGGMIVTSERALAAAKSITVIEADGTHQAATLVAVDGGSGLAVIQIGDDLPAADFQGSDPSVGKTVVAMAFDPARRKGASPDARLYAGKVTAGAVTGTPTTADELATITVAAPLSKSDVGCPLIDSHGEVSGLLESVERAGTSVVSVFLPADLVSGVVQQLVRFGRVDHGWLGVVVGDAEPDVPTTATTVDQQLSSQAPDGAVIESVVPGSPAAEGGLATGDVITGVDDGAGDVPIRSAAELGTALYADPPETPLQLTYRDASDEVLSTSVMLADDGDAPVLSSAP